VVARSDTAELNDRPTVKMTARSSTERWTGDQTFSFIATSRIKDRKPCQHRPYDDQCRLRLMSASV